MAFLGKWLSRAKGTTMAEHMMLRCGDGAEAKAARLLTAIASLLSAVGSVTYFSVGAGKFGAGEYAATLKYH